VQEVSIGHALIADALELGYAATVPRLPALHRRGRRSAKPAYFIQNHDLRHRHRHLRRAAHPRQPGAPRRALCPQGILSDGELATWQARSARWPERGVRYLATRFSAKEAFSKAIGLGMRMPMTWRLCEIAKPAQRQARHRAAWRAQALVRGRGLSAHVSVTDEPTTPPASVWSRKWRPTARSGVDQLSKQ
jgi:phosphopantetheinyl transferase (holo-ACP synthase)